MPPGSWAPSSWPNFGNMCSEVKCGEGNCTVDSSYPFNFQCECEDGWMRTHLFNDTNLKFLPCIVPNCSLNYSCMPAAPPAPAIPYNNNYSSFDPCDFVYCGEGTCTKNATYTHTCQCDTGAYNLFNNSAFPCYKNCALGSDCEKLGIRVSNSTSSPPGSQATALLPGKFHWIAIISILMLSAMVLWK